MDKNYLGWELSTGWVSGFLFGIRTYQQEENHIDHVLYLGIFDICLTIYYG
tara:strand:- start:244 stop:396 length:153 start_codon:yes stop_codon:yes gene_type:complete